MLFRNVVRKQRTMAQMSTHIFSALLYRLQTPTPNTIDDIFTPKYHAKVKICKEKCYDLSPIFPGIICNMSPHATVGFTQVITASSIAGFLNQQLPIPKCRIDLVENCSLIKLVFVFQLLNIKLELMHYFLQC